MDNRLLLAARLPQKATIGVSNPNGFDSFTTLEDFIARWKRTDKTYITCIVGNNYNITQAIALGDIDEINFATDRTTYSFTSGAKHIAYNEKPLLIKVWGNDPNGSYTTIGTVTLYADGRKVTFKDIISNSQIYAGKLNEATKGDLTLINFATDKQAQYFCGVVNGTSITYNDELKAEVIDSHRIVNGAVNKMSVYAGFLNGTANFTCLKPIKVHWKGGNANIVLCAPQYSTNTSAVQSITIGRTELVIDSGSLGSASGGPNVTSSTKSFTTQGTDIIINGGTFSNAVTTCGVSNKSQCTVNGDCSLTINGGTFNGSVYGGIAPYATGGRYCENAVINGNITITLNGGTFTRVVSGGGGDFNQINGNIFMDIGPSALFTNSESFFNGGSVSGTFEEPYCTGTKKLRVRNSTEIKHAMPQGSFNEIEIAGGYTPTFTSFDLSRSELKVHTSAHPTFTNETWLQTITLIEDEGATSGTFVSFTNGFTPNADGDEYDFKVYVEQNGAKTQATKVSDFEYVTDDFTIELAQDCTSISYRRNEI